MFSVITNIYNKKTKGPILMELFTATGKLKKFFFWGGGTTREVRCVHHGWHGTYRYDIEVLATHVDFCLHRHPVLVHCLYHARMVLSVGGSFAYFGRNARCTATTDSLVWYPNTENDFSLVAAIFSLHTLATPSGRNVNYDEKQLIGEKNWVVPSICTGFVNTCPTYSSEISPTRCNNCVFILRNGFTLHVSSDNLTHHQEYISCIWPQVSRFT